MARSPSLAQVAAQVRACRLCGLCEGRTNAVPGEGPTATGGILLVGEAPGRNEDETGRPFAGAAGRNLDLGLAEAGLTRADVFVTSVVKCRPPGNRDPTRAEKEACRPYLEAQLALLRPRVVVALGRHALESLVPGAQGDGFAHLPGSFMEGPGGVPVFVSLHPAAIIYRQKWKADYLVHWKQFGEWVRGGTGPTTP